MAETETPEALLNDVVLENIFKYLGYKDLKASREVGNVTWLRNSTKAWWALTKVVLVQKEGEPNPILEYLNQTDISSNAIHYKLNGIRGNYFEFWERLGHSIKELELSYCTFNSSDHFRHVIFTQCPNLEKFLAFSIFLEADTDILEPTEWEEPRFEQHINLKYIHLVFQAMPMSWMELLSQFPKLQFIKTSMVDVNVFKTISMIRQHDPNLLNLKHVEINIFPESDYDESIRSVFLDPKLSLETILIHARKCEPDTLLCILDLHAKSLKKLILDGESIESRIYIDNWNGPPVIRYPQQPLQALEELKVSHCIFPADIFRFTPNVRKVDLRFHHPSLHNTLERAERDVKVNSCKDLTLHVEGEWGDTPESDFEFFLKTFPNVEKLSVNKLTNSKFSMICEHLTKLVSFEIDESRVDATGLLGFNPDSQTDGLDRNPNITNLKDLKMFAMAAGCLGRGIQMKSCNDISEEIKKLPHLKKFELRNYQLEEPQMWEEIFAKYSGH